MKTLLLSLLLLLPMSMTLAQDEPAPDKPEESIGDRIRRLVEELGDDSYQIREKAQKALEKIGKPALEALKKAYKSADLEVTSRAEELIEKITGKKLQPKSDPEDKPSVPNLRPETPEMPFDPNDMKEMLEKFEEFKDLSPNLKKTLDSFRKLLEGDEDGDSDLGTIGDLFTEFFGKKPKTPEPSTPVRNNIEKELGLTVKPIDDVLRAHLRVSPRSGLMPPLMLKYGLVIENIDPNGHAFTQGLRKHDILIFVSSRPAPKMPLREQPIPHTPGPEDEWNKWRNNAIVIGKAEQLNSLKTKKVFVEVIRKGRSCHVVEIEPLTKKRDF